MLVKAAVLVMALAVPGTAAAAAREHRLTTPHAFGLEAEGGWTVWAQSDPTFPRGVVRWRRSGHVVESRAPAGVLGTNARGGVVVIDRRCRAQNCCTVSERPAARRRS